MTASQIAAIRAEFPLIAKHDRVYFDNAATTLPKSKGALRAYKKAFQSCGNASRGGHPFAARASEPMFCVAYIR